MAHEGGITEPQALHGARVELMELIVLTWGQLVQLVKDTGEKLPGEPCGPYLAMKAAIRAIHGKTMEERNRPDGGCPPARATRAGASPEAAAGTEVPDPNDWIVLVENKIGLDGPKVTFVEPEEERALCGRLASMKLQAAGYPGTRPTLWWLIKDVTSQLGTTKRVKPAVDEFRKRGKTLVDEVFF